MLVIHPGGVLPGVDDVRHYLIPAYAVFHLGENKRAVAAHLPRVPRHHVKVRANGGQLLGLRSRLAFPRTPGAQFSIVRAGFRRTASPSAALAPHHPACAVGR